LEYILSSDFKLSRSHNSVCDSIVNSMAQTVMS